ARRRPGRGGRAVTIETPTGRLLGTWPDGSPEWHAARASRLGGSDMAAVLGRSPWVSPYRLWHLKAGKVVDGPASVAQARGHYLAAGTRRRGAGRHTDLEVATGGTSAPRRRDRQPASPERVVLRAV